MNRQPDSVTRSVPSQQLTITGCDISALNSVLAGEPIETWFARARRILKSTAKLEAVLIQAADREWFVKKYRANGWPKRLAGAVGVNRARHNHDMSKALGRAGVPVVETACWVQQGRFPRAWYLVNEALSDAVTLKEGTLGQLEGLGFEAWWQQIADLMAQMHEAGLTHGDMKWANLMIDRQRRKIFLIDLDGVRRSRFRHWRGAARDLARFLLSAREFGVDEALVERFLCRYATHRRISRTQLDRLVDVPYRKLAGRHRRQYGAPV